MLRLYMQAGNRGHQGTYVDLRPPLAWSIVDFSPSRFRDRWAASVSWLVEMPGALSIAEPSGLYTSSGSGRYLF